MTRPYGGDPGPPSEADCRDSLGAILDIHGAPRVQRILSKLLADLDADPDEPLWKPRRVPNRVPNPKPAQSDT